MLQKAPNKAMFEIPEVRISYEPYGLGLRKGDAAFLVFANQTLLDMEKSDQAQAIFGKWFGPESATPLARTFRIQPD